MQSNRVADFAHALDETLLAGAHFKLFLFNLNLYSHLHLQGHVCNRRVSERVNHLCANSFMFEWFIWIINLFLPMEMLKFSAHSACSALPLVVAFLVSRALEVTKN
jgi:hypothetical protein